MVRKFQHDSRLFRKIIIDAHHTLNLSITYQVSISVSHENMERTGPFERTEPFEIATSVRYFAGKQFSRVVLRRFSVTCH